MGICYVVGGGSFSGKISPEKDDLIIAADSGYESLKSCGITPCVCIGDFDSLGYVPNDCKTIILPVEKDETDLIACINYALENGYRDFRLYGVLGGSRFSHSYAAVQTLSYISSKDGRGEILSENVKVSILSNENKTFSAASKGDISVFSISDTSRVTIKGLKYTLNDYLLKNDFPLGISNSFIGEEAEIQVSDGKIVIIQENF